MKIKYSELYEKDFLEKFGEYAEEIGKLELNLDVPVIDLEKIAEICDVTIEYKKTDYLISGESHNTETGRKIIVNRFENNFRKRFTIAHELGHIILGHVGVSFRKDLEHYNDELEKAKEYLANQFAAEILMPENLLFSVFEKTLEQKNYKKNQELDNELTPKSWT